MSKGSYRGLFDLGGKTSVVTGGAGILGKEFCSALADHGSNIAIWDINFEKAQEAAEEIASKFDVKSVGMGVDVSCNEAVVQAVDEVEKDFGEIDILHNNAASKSSNLDRFLI
jgi:NAD(P)-dependent dehydrogenase (short-subunit alcohol dehydrogenase family)